MTARRRQLPLRPDTKAPELIVDLSNVCHDGRRDARPAWARFERVLTAWCEHAGGVPRGIAIADASLSRKLSHHDRREFERAEMGRAIRVVAEADAEILALARRTDASVLSKDKYRGHRRDHPWIQGCKDRFFEWELGKGGPDRIIPREMGKSTAFSISEHEEKDRLKHRRLTGQATRELLKWDYRCGNLRCQTAREHPTRLPGTPRTDQDGNAVCPDCREPLIRVGPKRLTFEIVVEVDGTDVLRELIEAGQSVEIGRADLLESAEGSTREPLKRVSKRHLRISLNDGGLAVEDLGSKNGTTVARWDKKAKRHRAEAPLLPGRDTQLGGRDVVTLGGVATLRRSGQRYPVADTHRRRIVVSPGSSATTENEPA